MKNIDQTILFAIDLDDVTLFKFERSYPNLKHIGNRVILLYVFENLKSIPSEKMREEEVFKKNTKLKAIADDIRNKTGLEVSAVLQKGKAAEEILNASMLYNASVIGMSTHTNEEDNYTKNHAIGSTTNKVVRESTIPVFTFNSNVKLKKIERILLPLDLTAETKQKVTNAIDMARRFNADISIISAFWSPKYDDIKEQLVTQLNQVKGFIEEADIKCTAELVEADGGERMLAPTVLDYADNNNIDLIMVMTQQETRLTEFFMGSAAQTIIRLSKTPVMSIIPKELWSA